MRKLLLFYFFIFSLVTYAQGEANIWYFGRHAGLDFNSGSPVALKDGQIDTDEGCATLSDSSGQLLFYTDGLTVWNKKHQIMGNGAGLLGHPSSTQSATIVQKPNSPNLFYVFTIDAEVGANGFRYSIVDIMLNNGLGDVTTDKNILVYAPTCEKISIATAIIPFVVVPVPNIQLTGDELVCSDLPTFTKIINAGLLYETKKNNFTYTWTLDGNSMVGETKYDWAVNKKGVYKVKVTNSQGCSRTRTITVNASDKATVKVDIVDLSSENSITVLATGVGDYVFSLDNEYGDYQNSNSFTNVSAAIHTVYVKDLNGCGIVPQEVAILGIPNYFTLNHDGYNDTWNLKGVNAVFNAKTTVRIFDRCEKLIKEISPMGDSWDGTYFGQQMPATDYWYSVQLQDGRIFKGHFALKR